jgi:hypothetical protein
LNLDSFVRYCTLPCDGVISIWDKHTYIEANIALNITVNDLYASDPAGAAAAIPYASVYSAPTTGAPTYSTESPLYMQQNITAPYQTIYPVRNPILIYF